MYLKGLGFLCGFAHPSSTLHGYTRCTPVGEGWGQDIRETSTTLKIKTKTKRVEMYTAMYLPSSPLCPPPQGRFLTTVPHRASRHACLVAGYFLRPLEVQLPSHEKDSLELIK